MTWKGWKTKWEWDEEAKGSAIVVATNRKCRHANDFKHILFRAI